MPEQICYMLHETPLFLIDDWKLFLTSRGRDWDKIPGFSDSYELNKKYIHEATLDHCIKKSIKVIHFKQEFGDPYIQAEKLIHLLMLEDVI